MSNKPSGGGFEPPSGKSIAIGSGVALGAAIVVLLVAVLPAEYCKDPTGLGSLMGITCMSSGAGATRTIELVDNIGGNETLREVEIPDFDDPVPLPNPAIAQHETEQPVTRSVTVALDASGATEVKTIMRKDKVIVYEWKVDDGLVYSDFHGHNPEYGSDFWVQYKEDQRGAASGSGSLVAPFDGQHGWYWQNLSDHPVNVTLTVTGFIDDLVDLSEDF